MQTTMSKRIASEFVGPERSGVCATPGFSNPDCIRDQIAMEWDWGSLGSPRQAQASAYRIFRMDGRFVRPRVASSGPRFASTVFF